MSESSADPVDDSTYTASLDTGVDAVVDLDEAMGSDNIDAMLDTSYSPVERPLGMDKFGTTAAEQLEGESLDQRLSEEEPDPAMDVYGDADTSGAPGGPVSDDLDARRGGGLDGDLAEDELPSGELSDGEINEVGDVRAGRLVDPDEGAHTDVDKDMVGRDVGIDGAAATAEEAAMHVIDDDSTAVDEGSSI